MLFSSSSFVCVLVRKFVTRAVPVLACSVVCAVHARAQGIVTGSDGSDGAFAFVPDTPGGSTMTIDLALAASGLDGGGMPITWQTPSPVPGRGVYDPAIWAVVFKYSAVTVPASKTVRFRNHPSRAPVVWLVQGNVLLDTNSWVRADAQVEGFLGTWFEPGPGGFRGSSPSQNPGGLTGAGFGPGGGESASRHYGNHASAPNTFYPAPYGSAGVQPLFGGSGGSALGSANWGGAGGGAHLIVAGQRFEQRTGAWISARGGFPWGTGAYPGSGGALRVVADVIALASGAVIDATGVAGSGTGRIRLEANAYEGSILTTPPASISTPGAILPDASAPSVRAVSATRGGTTVPISPDPRASFSPPQADVNLTGSGTVTIQLEARNVAPGRTCSVRVADLYGIVSWYTSTPLSGTSALSTASVDVPLATGIHAIQVKVSL